jgi:hypothetical protein
MGGEGLGESSEDFGGEFEVALTWGDEGWAGGCGPGQEEVGQGGESDDGGVVVLQREGLGVLGGGEGVVEEG